MGERNEAFQAANLGGLAQATCKKHDVQKACTSGCLKSMTRLFSYLQSPYIGRGKWLPSDRVNRHGIDLPGEPLPFRSVVAMSANCREKPSDRLPSTRDDYPRLYCADRPFCPSGNDRPASCGLSGESPTLVAVIAPRRVGAVLMQDHLGNGCDRLNSKRNPR